MNFPAYLRSLAARFLHRSEVAEDMEEELRSHIQYRADDLERSGLDRAQAERQARIEFGARERFKEECHQAMGGHFFETLVQDVRFAVRVLRKSPGFTFAAVVTLALAIGANAVVFGIMDGLLLRTLNVPQWETLWGTMNGTDPGWQSYPNYVDLRDRNHSFEDLAAFKFAFTAMETGKDLSVANGFATSGNYFDVLRIQPYLGHVFHASDEHGPNSAPYIVLTYAYWHTRFQDDRGVIGRVVQLNKHPFTIIGVAPPGFQGTLLFISPDFFMPIVNQAQVDGENLLNARGSDRGVFEVMGHLKPGVTPAQAIADMNAVGAYLEKTYPKEFAHQSFFPGTRRPHCFHRSGARIRCWIDAAGRLDPAGRVRQSGQPVCGSRCRSLARSCTSARAWIKPQSHPAAIIDGSGADFARRGRSGTAGQHRVVATAEHVAAL